MGRADICVIGAGPYGLTAAAHLRAAGLNTCVFGGVMSFWRAMPSGMLLRSTREGISLRDPRHALTLADFERERNAPLETPVNRSEYISYVEWYQRHAVPEIDPRMVAAIERADTGFLLTLADGDVITTLRVVVAVGLDPFKRRLAAFDDLPPARAPHSFDACDFAAQRGKRVLVVGSGQSALESAAMLVDAGAEVELVSRSTCIHWLPQSDHINRDRSLWTKMLYPPGAIGPPGINWIVQLPKLYRSLPGSVQARVFDRAVRPAGSGRLRPHLELVKQSLGRTITGASLDGEMIRVRLDNSRDLMVDHVVQGAGFQVDVSRMRFLSPEIVRSLRTIGGQPRLGAGFESSVSGLSFLGSASDLSFGPLMRAIAGTAFAAHTLSSRAAAELGRPGPIPWGRTMEMLEQAMTLVPSTAGQSAAVAAVVGILAPTLGVDSSAMQEIINSPSNNGPG